MGIFFEKEITTQDRLIHEKNQIWTLVFRFKTYMNENIYVMINKSSTESLHKNDELIELSIHSSDIRNTSIFRRC